jgi:sugar porter (SP) family MFS transporter
MALNSSTASIDQPRRQHSVYFVSIIAAFGGLLFGYDTGVISGAQLFLVRTFSLTPQLQEWSVSCVLIGAMIGALIAGRVNDTLGRKRTLIALAILFIIGALLTSIAQSLSGFIIFRMIVGVGIGAAASVVPVYISEVSPSHIRGKLMTFQQLMITIGIAVSYWIDLLFVHLGMGWRPMFAVAAIPGLILLIGMLFNPESPRWYASKGRWDEALMTLEDTKGADPQRELAEIHVSLAEASAQRSFKDLFLPGIRWALLVGVGLAVLQQLVGVNTVIYYAPTIFESAGVSSTSSAILATSIVGVVNVLSTIAALLLVDLLGRKVLLIAGSVGMAIGLGALGAVFATHAAGGAIGLTLTSLIIYIIAFAISMGPVFWVMSAEVFPTRVRAAGSATSTFMNWLFNFLVSVTFLSLVGAIGSAFTFWLYGLICIVTLLFCLFIVPETKGRSLEEIETYWANDRHWEPLSEQTTVQPQGADD